MSDVRDRKNILDIFVVWHPGATDDRLGERVFWQLSDHFHSPSFSGLAGGAIEVYQRSVGWNDEKGEAPRPLGISEKEKGVPPLKPSQFNVIIPVVSTELKLAVSDDESWREYFKKISDLYERGEAFVFPLVPETVEMDGPLGSILRVPQRIPSTSLKRKEDLMRDLCQAIVQNLSAEPGENPKKKTVQVFISHTRKSSSVEDAKDGGRGKWGETKLIERIKDAIDESKLYPFFDSTSLQSGDDWREEIEKNAGTSALLMIRTDRFARQKWTQREVAISKRHDMPIVSIDALSSGEEQGSFIMDHVPTVKYDPRRPDETVRVALSKLLDEALKRELWKKQKSYFKNKRGDGSGFDWMPANSPEPVTLVDWLRENTRKNLGDEIWVIHPDPPLGEEEERICEHLCRLVRSDIRRVNMVTPRTFRTRGGISPRPGSRLGRNPEVFPPDALKGVSVALSVSAASELTGDRATDQDIEILGFSPTYRKEFKGGDGILPKKEDFIYPVRTSHLSLVVAEIARAVFLAGGKIFYGGRLRPFRSGGKVRPPAFTEILLEEAKRYGEDSGSNDALKFYLSYSEHASMPRKKLQQVRDYLGNYSGRLCLLSEEGEVLNIQTEIEAKQPQRVSEAVAVRSLTAMRKKMAEDASARIIVGGGLSGFGENIPGILEEARTCLEARKPLYIAGGFGGASALLAKKALPKVLPGVRGKGLFSWAPEGFPRQPQDPDEFALVEKTVEDIGDEFKTELRENGLDDRGIEKLAITHRPSDIATLLVLGLSTKFNRSTGKGEEGA